MIAFVKFRRDEKDKNRRNYHCARCGRFITHSGAVIRLNGSENHSFINPSGILCNFITFEHCENVMVHRELYLEHSWFSGYGWRFLMCANCVLHLGWKYDAVTRIARPSNFYGVLVDGLDLVSQEE